MKAGDELPHLVEELSFGRIATSPGATGDHFPGHYDVAYAQAQGQPTIYANSLQLFALLDRAVLSWAGPRAFLVRRAVQLQLSLYAGDTASVSGTATAVHDALVDLSLTMTNQHGGTICTAEATVRLSRP